MDRRKFLKSFAFIPVALTSGCVATFSGKETKFDPNPVPQEKKHFERNIFMSTQDAWEHFIKYGLKEGDLLVVNDFQILEFKHNVWIKYKG